MPFNVCRDSACRRINSFVIEQRRPRFEIDLIIINPEKKKKRAGKKSVKPHFDSFETALRGALADGEISKKERKFLNKIRKKENRFSSKTGRKVNTRGASSADALRSLYDIVAIDGINSDEVLELKSFLGIENKPSEAVVEAPSKEEKLSSKQKFDKVFDQTLEENPGIIKTLINLSVLSPIAGLAQRLGFDGILQNFIDADGAGKTSWLRKQLDFFVSHNGGYDNVPRIASDYQSHRASGKTLSEFLLDKEGAYGSSYLPGVRPLIGAFSPLINLVIQPMADIFSGNLLTSFDQEADVKVPGNPIKNPIALQEFEGIELQTVK